MAGLLGFMAAGAAKGYSEARGKELLQEQEYDLKAALLDAQLEKELRLKEAGFKLDDKRKEQEMERNKKYMADVETTTKTPESVINKYTDENGQEQVVKSGGDEVTTTRKASLQDGAQRAMEAGDFETSKGLLGMVTKREGFSLSEGQSRFDADGKEIASLDPKKKDVNINDMILLASQGDEKAKKFLDTMSAIDIKKAIAGRTPQRETDAQTSKRDFMDANAENPRYVKDGKLTAEGFDKFNKAETGEFETITEKPLLDMTGKPVIKDGKPVMVTSRSRKVPVKNSTGSLVKDKDKNGNYNWNS